METIARLSNDESNAPAFGMSNEATERIYNEQLKNPQLIHKEVYNHTRNVLHRAVDKVYGQPKYTDDEFQKAFELKQNLSRFAGFKSAWQSKELADAGGTDQAHAINNTYNSNWLRTEYVHAVRSSRGAKRWGQMQADKDLYPFLQYMPSTSAEPRSDHRRMYGVIKHLDDSFWDRWFPPNDWGCKCGTAPMRGDEDSRPMPDDITPPVKAMRNNPGKTGKIITDDHAMIKSVSAKGKERIAKQAEYLERSAERASILSSTKGVRNVFTPTEIGEVKNLTKRSVNNAMDKADFNTWQMIPEIPTLLLKSKLVDTRLPKNPNGTVKYSHFLKLPVKEQIFAVVWEDHQGNKWFHSLSRKIVGKKPPGGRP